jgi:rhodanese-related sulfurtransferase
MTHADAAAGTPPTTVRDLLSVARARIDRHDPSSARAAQAQGAVIVDTRCGEDRAATGSIPGSVHIPLSVLYWRLDRTSGPHLEEELADRERHLILVCADGYSSSLAAATLRDLGFTRADDLDGGFNRWLAEDMPVER